jgi:glycosyltransferase involved in cell wall biosynthesis
MARADASAPRVTAVIPAYNMEAFLERALTSAAGQTYPHLDILVIDDGSTDGTRAIAERFAAGHERVRVESVANAGVAAARNLGTRLARSAYVAYLDADDLWHPAKIEKQVAALAAHGHDGEWAACYTLSRYIDRNDRVLGNASSAEARGDFFEKHLYRNHVDNGSCLLVRRDAALAVGGFDPTYASRGIGGVEDYEFQLKLLRRYKLELVREFLVGYRIYAGQMSHDAARMGRARIATIESVLAASDLPRSRRREVVTHARVVAVHQEAVAGDWLNAAATLAGSVVRSPRLTLGWLVELAKIKRQRMRAAARAEAAGEDAGRPLARFGDFAPEDGVASADDVNDQPRARLAALRDRPAGPGPAGEAPADRTAAGRPARSAK